MKKAISLLLVLVMCLSLCACGNTQQNDKLIQEAVERWPWFVDSWYTTFIAEGTILEISEDGACSLSGVNGTWTWDSTRGGSDGYVPLSLKMENGECYLLEFILEGDSWVRAMAQNMETGENFPIGDYLPGIGEGEIRSSDSITAVFERSNSVIGEWVSLENEYGYSSEEAFMNIREDGTCVILSEEGVWGLPTDWQDAEEIEYLLIKTDNNNYGIQIDSTLESGYRYIYIHTLTDGADSKEFASTMNLRFPVDAEETEPEETEPEETEPTYTTIEITLDNWQEYFEIRNYVSTSTNDFGEVNDAMYGYCLSLKDEYISKVDDADVAVEYYFSEPCYVDIEYNIETGQAVVGEVYTEERLKDKNFLPITSWLSKEDSGTFSFNSRNIDGGRKYKGMIRLSDEGNAIPSEPPAITDNVATWCSTFYQNAEIVRIQGTLTIIE